MNCEEVLVFILAFAQAGESRLAFVELHDWKRREMGLSQE
jgi:hypothetical protein